uniref:Immunoglobulin domain-containing protein n=1 Tax=Scleropages formosus TaxID=113540 RepID=A0A8C9TDF7_SCLFO
PTLKATLFFLIFKLFLETTMRRRERDTVTLHTGVTDVQKDSQILWYSGSGIEDLIAQLINGATQTDINERFRDRLELDTQTGSLTIRNLNTSDSGVYRVHRVKGKLPVTERRERDTVTLHTGVTDVQKDSVILWYFRSGVDDLIAQFIKGETETDFDERFRDRLELDTQTGSLTIRNLNTSDSGVYRVHRVKGKPPVTEFQLVVYIYTTVTSSPSEFFMLPKINHQFYCEPRTPSHCEPTHPVDFIRHHQLCGTVFYSSPVTLLVDPIAAPLSCRSSSMNFTSLFSSNCSLSGSIFSQLPPSRAGVQTSDSNSTAGHRGPVLFLQATVFSGERQRCDPVLDQREGDAEPDQQSSSQHHPVSPSGHRGAGQ